MLCLAVFALLLTTAVTETITVTNVVHDGPVIVEETSTRKNIDWVKLSPGANETSYEW